MICSPPLPSSNMAAVAHKKYVFDDGILKLHGEPVKIYYFDDDALAMPWFQVKLIHNFLGAKKIGQTMARVYDDNKSSLKELLDQKGSPIGDVASGALPLTAENVRYHDGKSYYVNEPGLYQIIFGSDKPEAKAFANWMTAVVLPALRKTETFSMKRRNTASNMTVATQLVEPSAKRFKKELEESHEILIAALQQKEEELLAKQHSQFTGFLKASFCDWMKESLEEYFSSRHQQQSGILKNVLQREKQKKKTAPDTLLYAANQDTADKDMVFQMSLLSITSNE